MYLAYCDDEQISLEYMQHLVEQWAQERGTSVHIKLYKSAQELLFENMTTYPFDVIILDIDMEGMNGMHLAHKIRETDAKVPIIFLTNHKEYVFEGYEVGAFRYLLKPIDRQRLDVLLDEINKTLDEESPYMIIYAASENVKLNTSDLLYVEAQGHYLTLHTQKQNYEIKQSLSEFKEKLDALTTSPCFISTHRSYLVHLGKVEKILREECVLNEGSHIPISRSAYKKVNEAFIHYYRRH